MSRGICQWCDKPHDMEPYKAWCSQECEDADFDNWLALLMIGQPRKRVKQLTKPSKFDIINNRERDNPAYMEYDT